MSLIIAEMINGNPFIISDTKITLPHEEKSNQKNRNLKIILISEDIALCYAGNVEVALKTFRHIYALNLKEISQILSILKNTNAENSGIVDFMLITHENGGSIYRIKEGNIETHPSSSWIGDKTAFEKYQEYKSFNTQNIETRPKITITGSGSVEIPYSPDHPELGNMVISFQAHNEDGTIKPPSDNFYTVEYPDPLEKDTQEAITKSFKEVIDNQVSKTVGGFSIRVRSEAGKFQFLEEMAAHIERDTIINEGDCIINKYFQSIEEGGFSYTTTTPSSHGVTAYAINFPRANLTFFFNPLVADEAIIIKDISSMEIINFISQEYSVNLNPIIIK